LNKRRPATLLTAFHKLYRLYGPQGWWPGHSRFEIITGAILTQNTAWTNVEKAIARLKGAVSLASPSELHGLRTDYLARLIRPAGCYNLKAVRLKNFTLFLSKRYGASLDRLARLRTGKLRDELLNVNGIGPETCDSILLYAFKRPVFVVDAYTKRIFSRHGLFHPNSDYGTIRGVFTANLPSEEGLFNEYHALIVRLGKEYCGRRPRCGECPFKDLNFVANDAGR